MSSIPPDQKCQCYFCFHTFRYDEIEDWVDNGKTPLCPNCDIDAVLLEHVGQIKLRELHEKWFTARSNVELDDVMYFRRQFEQETNPEIKEKKWKQFKQAEHIYNGKRGKFRPTKERMKQITDGCAEKLKKFDSPGKVK